jgi:LCP family protein required for cell wall assembly
VDEECEKQVEEPPKAGAQEDPEPERSSSQPYPRSAEIEPDTAPAPPPAALPRRRLRTAVKVVLALVSVVALAATGYAYLTKGQLQQTVPTTDALTTQPGEPAPPADDDATDILLVGSDARTDAQGHPLPLNVLKSLRTEEKAGVNTDTIIVLRIPKDGGKPAGISIPRDAWVDIPGRGKAKINSAYGVAKAQFAIQQRRNGVTDQAAIERDSDQAGRKVLVQTVQDFTQLRIDHYAEVNLLGFYLLTQALGGVQVCLNHATEDKDSGANFRAGQQTVSGGEALSFVRQRKNLPHGDLDRIVRQQVFLSSALHQMLSTGTLTSPSTLSRLMDAVHRSIVVDPGLDLLDLAQQVKGVASGGLSFETIPVLNINGRSEDGQQSIVEVDPAAVRQFVAGLAGHGIAPTSAPTSAPSGGAPTSAPASAPTGGSGAPSGGGGSEAPSGGASSGGAPSGGSSGGGGGGGGGDGGGSGGGGSGGASGGGSSGSGGSGGSGGGSGGRAAGYERSAADDVACVN